MATKKKITNKKIKNSQNKKIDSISSSYQSEFGRVIKCLVIVILILIAMYFVTKLILKNSTDTSYTKEEKTSIQYSEILLGTVFDKKDDEYLVLFYYANDNDNTYTTLMSDYEAKDERLPIYYVDLNNKMNKNCISTDSNKKATNANELKINDATLIKFSNNKISDYLIGEEEISNYLNN